MMEDTKPPRPPGNRKKRPPRSRRGGPQAQQMKVTLRKIEDMDRYGTVAQISEMVRMMIEKVNSESKNKAFFLPIQLDEKSVQQLIEEEQLAAAAKEAANAQEENEEQDSDEPMEEIKEEPMVQPQEEEMSEKNADTTKSVNESPKYATVVKGVVDQATGPVMNARALYVVPPKKSRRRGIKSGCAYLVLNGPNVSEEDGANMTPAQRSHATAKARLQLTTAVEALSKHAQEDSKSSQLYAGCVIQPSMSGKAWKQTYRYHRESTVESTGDYKRFMANIAKEEDERLSRPKPTPGGALNDGKSENGEPVAAIVKHLRAKRQQEARRKMATRKKVVYEPKGKKNPSSKRGPKPQEKKRGRGRNKVGNGAASMPTPLLMKTGGDRK